MSERLENFPKAQNFHAFGNALCYNGREPCFERRGTMYIKLTLQEKLKDERTNRHMTLAELEKATGIANFRELLQGQIYLSFYSFFMCTAIL